jgi:hypothetical protein
LKAGEVIELIELVEVMSFLGIPLWQLDTGWKSRFPPCH